MKRLVFLMLLAPFAFGQTIDTVKVTDTPNQGRVKWNAAINYLAPIFNVKSAPFNAKGDGVANDGAAISAAESAARSAHGSVYFPNGIYNLGGTYSISSANMAFIGESPAEYDMATNTFGYGVRLIGSFGASTDFFSMRNITISEPNGNDVCITSGSHQSFVNCRFVGRYSGDLAHAFLTGSASDVLVMNCKSYKTVHGFASRSSNVQFVNCKADSCGFDGIVIKSGDGEHNSNIVVSNFVVRYSATGVLVIIDANTSSSLKNVSVMGGTVDSCSGAGVYVLNYANTLDSMRSIVISGIAVKNSAYGMLGYQAANVSISASSVNNVDGMGYGFANCRDILVTGSMADSTGGYGFSAYGTVERVRAEGCASRRAYAGLAVGGFTSWSVNDELSKGTIISSAPSSPGITGGGYTGNIQLNTMGDSSAGTGQTVSFGQNSYTLSEILGGADPIDGYTGGAAYGYLKFSTKAFDGIGWSFFPGLAIHSYGDVDIGRVGFYEGQWNPTRLRVYAGQWDWNLQKWYSYGNTSTPVATLDTLGGLTIGSLKSRITSAKIDSFKVIADSLCFYIGGTKYRAVK